MLQQTIKRSLKGVLLVLAFIVCTPATAGDPLNGRTFYNDHCKNCHGASGKGDDFGVPSFSEGNIMFSLDADILPIIKDGRGMMPAFKGVLTDQDILDVISYVRTLD